MGKARSGRDGGSISVGVDIEWGWGWGWEGVYARPSTSLSASMSVPIPCLTSDIEWYVFIFDHMSVFGEGTR